MKKRVILGTILPVFAAVAVIGSGYAIWHFNDTASKLDTSMTFGIENVVQGASLNPNFDSLKLTFDQTTASRETVNSAEASALGFTSIDSNGTDSAKGIYLTASKTESGQTSTVTDPTVEYKNVTTEGVNSYATPENSDNKVGQVFTVTLSMPTTVANYITITLDTNTATGWKATDPSTVDSTTWVWTNTTYGEATWKWSYVSFSYATGDTNKEPTNISEYAALSSAIKTASSATATYQAYRWAK